MHNVAPSHGLQVLTLQLLILQLLTVQLLTVQLLTVQLLTVQLLTVQWKMAQPPYPMCKLLLLGTVLFGPILNPRRSKEKKRKAYAFQRP